MCRRVIAARTRRSLAWCAIVAVWQLLAATTAHGQVTLSAGALALSVNAQGEITALRSSVTGKDYRYAGMPSPLITVVHAGARLAPTAMQLSTAGGVKTLALRYAGGVRVGVRVRETAAYLALEIVRAEPSAKVEAVIWGPYATTIGHTVGEVVGVVQDGDVALGLQVLNAKTLGGDLPNREGSTWARGIAARQQAWGSFLNAYAINRARARTVDGWGGDFPNMPVSPIAGETVVGSAIALFLTPAAQALDAMERIEVAEGLPHPTIDGVWFRKSPLFERSYMISDFGEAEVDQMIGYATRSGLYSLYHEGPFKNWGHFVLDSARWPSGRPGLKAAVAKARAAGLHFGVHTLTNFINTNDPYVTPVPDERLAVTGISALVSAVDTRQTEIEVRSPEYFANDKHDNLHTVRIGAELIQYRAVTATAPYRLLDCQRGAFGTTPAAHAASATVGKLLDHPYKVFFPNFAMQREVARNLADFLNETGVDHIDFDGHEGALASGQGDYALAVFASDVLSQVRHDLINGTSISKTFYWHIGSYYNWGEPWYGGFAESMQQYRIDNQALFARNFMPHMLGWYLLTETTTRAEMEWMLARAAGYGAGFAMVARPKALRGNPLTPQLLDAIREWESARTSRAFDSAQVARLKDPAREFHLERVADGAWRLYEMAMSPAFTRTRVERQPGEPTHTEWRFDQPWDEQRLQFRLRVSGAAGVPETGSAASVVRALRLTVDRYAALELPGELRQGESLVVDGTDVVRVYDATGKPKGRFTLRALPPMLSPGAHSYQMESDFAGDGLAIEVQFRGMGAAEPVRARR
ncbi:MAG: hypothetical protein P3B98_02025 [Gemmatimonadota bacterium]|nr:hypothetical protein [Gemmatimonadota bacterium]